MDYYELIVGKKSIWAFAAESLGDAEAKARERFPEIDPQLYTVAKVALRKK